MGKTLLRVLYLPHEYSQQRQREKKRKIYPIRMAMEATYRKLQGDKVDWRVIKDVYDEVIFAPEGIPFLKLPHADRILTRWWEYQDNGNFKYYPATYIMSASGCWHGKCTFCVEKGQKYEVREVEDVLDEIGECIEMGFREIFDDSATFPNGLWWLKFCQGMIKRGYYEKVKFGCNWRLGDWYGLKAQLLRDEFKLMKKAGFRMLLIGVESASQYTLNKINKGVDNDSIVPTFRIASEEGLEPHIAVMFGYPWERDSDALQTLRLVWWLLKKGYAKTAQASFYTPPDRGGKEEFRKYVSRIYDVWTSPAFWFNKIRSIKDKDDLKYLWKQIKAGIRRN